MNDNLIENLSTQPANIFARNEPGFESAIDEVENRFGLKFPDDYRQLLLLSDGGSIRTSGSAFNYEPTEYLVGHNLSEFFNTNIPGTIVIGDDGGGCIYYYDPNNIVGNGRWAVYYASMGALFFKESVYLGNSLNVVIEKILAGENFGNLLFK